MTYTTCGHPQLCATCTDPKCEHECHKKIKPRMDVLDALSMYAINQINKPMLMDSLRLPVFKKHPRTAPLIYGEKL